MQKGVFEFELGEPKKRVGFKFGTLALAVAEEKEGRQASAIFLDLQSGKVGIMTLLHLVYGAAIQYAENQKMPKDFNLDDVSDWVEEIGFDEFHRVITEGIKQYVPKNLKSPAQTGETITV